MSGLGMGAMIHQLSGGSPKSASDYYGRKITAATFDNYDVRLTFEDGVTIHIWDNGQSCCESRYISSDDDISKLVGKTLKSIDVKDGSIDDEHEIAFLEFVTNEDGVVFVAASHNEHNGYYGGFGLSLDEVR
jgi:hypothetical protein